MTRSRKGYTLARFLPVDHTIMGVKYGMYQYKYWYVVDLYCKYLRICPPNFFHTTELERCCLFQYRTYSSIKLLLQHAPFQGKSLVRIMQLWYNCLLHCFNMVHVHHLHATMYTTYMLSYSTPCAYHIWCISYVRSFVHPVFNEPLIQLLIVFCSICLPLHSQQMGERSQGDNPL